MKKKIKAKSLARRRCSLTITLRNSHLTLVMRRSRLTSWKKNTKNPCPRKVFVDFAEWGQNALRSWNTLTCLKTFRKLLKEDLKTWNIINLKIYCTGLLDWTIIAPDRRLTRKLSSKDTTTDRQWRRNCSTFVSVSSIPILNTRSWNLRRFWGEELLASQGEINQPSPFAANEKQNTAETISSVNMVPSWNRLRKLRVKLSYLLIANQKPVWEAT